MPSRGALFANELPLVGTVLAAVPAALEKVWSETLPGLGVESDEKSF